MAAMRPLVRYQKASAPPEALVDSPRFMSLSPPWGWTNVIIKKFGSKNVTTTDSWRWLLVQPLVTPRRYFCEVLVEKWRFQWWMKTGGFIGELVWNGCCFSCSGHFWWILQIGKSEWTLQVPLAAMSMEKPGWCSRPTGRISASSKWTATHRRLLWIKPMKRSLCPSSIQQVHQQLRYETRITHRFIWRRKSSFSSYYALKNSFRMIHFHSRMLFAIVWSWFV